MTSALQTQPVIAAGTTAHSRAAHSRDDARQAPAAASTAATAAGAAPHSANAPVFEPTAAAVIAAWARQANLASGFGGASPADLHAIRAAVAPPPSRARARYAPDLAAIAFRRLHARIAAWWQRQRAVARARATARQLADLDDRQLDDIGLSRSEILSAALESERRITHPAARVPGQRLA